MGISVAEFSAEIEAEIAQGALESQGIKSRVTCDNLGGLFSGISPAGPSAKIYVLAQDKAAALEIIKK